jgi:MYXO-CTERM domain-containing protein
MMAPPRVAQGVQHFPRRGEQATSARVRLVRDLRSLAVVLGLALLPGSATAAPSAFAKGPWLSQLGAREVTVRAETDPPAPISLRLTHDGKTTELSDPAVLFHSVHATGLEPRTRYEYTADVAGAKVTGSFTTAPADDDEASFRVLVYGDNRSDAISHAGVVRALEQETGDFLLNTGDLVGDGTKENQWQLFFDIEGTLLRDRCLFAAIGNHELEEASGANFSRYFGGDRTQVKGKLYGSMRWGRARFFFLNGEASFDGDDRSWLEEELTRADTEPNLRWRFIVVHNGLYASGVHGDNKAMHDANIPQMLLRHHVDLLIQGHDHLYERGFEGGLRYVVSGGGGAPLYPVRNKHPGTRKIESTHHVIALDVGKDTVNLVAKRLDGSAIEKASFTKDNGWDDDPAVVAKPVFPTPSATAAAGVGREKCSCDVVGAPSSGAPLFLAPFALLLPWLRRRR